MTTFEALATHYGAKIRFKSESSLMRLIGRILFFNPAFMKEYITTIGSTIYFPDRETANSQWGVLAHECVHIYDEKKTPIRYNLSYLFPQILALFSLGAFGAFYSLWFLLYLIFLLALLPMTAPWRVGIERRAYLMSIITDMMEHGQDWVKTDFYKQALLEIYTGPGYYFMARDKVLMRARIDVDIGMASAILSGFMEVQPYTDMIRIIKEATL